MGGSGAGWRGWWRMLVLALLVGITLAACGEEDADSEVTDNQSTRPEPTEMGAILSASPAAGTPGRGGLAQDLESARVTIQDGKLDPDRVEAQVGFPFVLTVVGDGQPHTLVIQDFVAETQIAPQGETQIQLSVPEGAEGEKDILLDGQDAGTFAAQGAGGITDP